MFGYITASFARFFVERYADSEATQVVGTRDLAALRWEIAALLKGLRQGR